MPAARIIRWEGIGHAPHIQAPDRFTELLKEFLEATGKRAARAGMGRAHPMGEES